eukprot:gb/GECG01008770.1/.p1 GENE.gb/GECG01008770.1/~~gb/GECG01008770.1/.p1  ORF type:complete len:533 (+),score=137.31 gb/GECG01008770.1/:1-1599(+)
MSGTFTRDDLGKLLGENADGEVPTKNDRTDRVKEFKPRVDSRRNVKRYWPGRAPDWAQKEEEKKEEPEASTYYRNLSNTQRSDDQQREKAEAEIVSESSSDSESDQEDSKSASHEHQSKTEERTVALPEATNAEGAVEEEDHKSRRARARARMKAKAAVSSSETVHSDETHDVQNSGSRDQPDAPSLAQFNLQTPTFTMSSLPLRSQKGKSDEAKELEESHAKQESTHTEQKMSSEDRVSAGESASDDSSESSEESDSDEHPSRQIAKPVFRRKDQRDTIRQKEEQEREEEEQRRREEEEREQQREESRKMVVEEVQKERETEKQEEEDPTMPDDEDRSDDEEEEFNEWRLRELYRIKRDKDEREHHEWEQAETERRRNLTQEERAKEDRELEKQGLKTFKKEKRSLGYMQKYYHRGAFYMDEDSVQQNDVRRRSYDAPTGEDKVDKSKLPEVMQVRGADFGKRSRTKWTHLAAEDTLKDTPWAQKDPLRQKYAQRLAGVKEDLDEAGRVVRGKKRRIIEDQRDDAFSQHRR